MVFGIGHILYFLRKSEIYIFCNTNKLANVNRTKILLRKIELFYYKNFFAANIKEIMDMEIEIIRVMNCVLLDWKLANLELDFFCRFSCINPKSRIVSRKLDGDRVLCSTQYLLYSNSQEYFIQKTCLKAAQYAD